VAAHSIGLDKLEDESLQAHNLQSGTEEVICRDLASLCWGRQPQRKPFIPRNEGLMGQARSSTQGAGRSETYLMWRFTLARTRGQRTTAKTAETKDLKSLIPRK
jgi:hypothetical protein